MWLGLDADDLSTRHNIYIEPTGNSMLIYGEISPDTRNLCLSNLCFDSLA